jgi:PAS domain S-box-containing protein
MTLRLDALVVADAHGVIRLWNEGAERIFGYAAARYDRCNLRAEDS